MKVIPIDPEVVRTLVIRTTTESGVPERLTDPATARLVGRLLRQEVDHA